jgi:hypothetical protein
MPHGVLYSWVYSYLECGNDPLDPQHGLREIPQNESLSSGLTLVPNLLRINTPTPPTSVDSKGFRELLSP